MRKAKLFYLVICVAPAMAALGCDPSNGPDEDEVGSTVVDVEASALLAADIARVTVTVTGQGISTPVVAQLVRNRGRWSGTIDNIPAGDNRTFLAQAFNVDGVLIYMGTAAGVTIDPWPTPRVFISLQQVNPAVPFGNAVPIITSFVASTLSVEPGASVTLAVTAADANPDDTLTYEWTATRGIFSATDSASTVWTAPRTPGQNQTVTISVSDPHGSIATASVVIAVPAPAATGSALIRIRINTSPEVQGLVPTPTRIDAGESTQLNLTATDSDKNTLAFQWSADCNGTFSNTGIEDPTFTLDSVTGNTCTLTALITDGRGGSNQAGITIQTGPGVTPEVPTDCAGDIVFPDPNLAQAVQDAMEMSSGESGGGDVRDLTYLDGVDRGISDLTGLECLTNLTILYLQINNISDITPLSGLTNLMDLHLDINSISDITPLSGLTNLEELGLDNNPISDITTLSGLINLERLNLANNNISDLTPLSGLIALTGLSLNSDNINDITALSGLINLRDLRVGSDNLSDITPLSGLTDLHQLELYGTGITDLTPLSVLTNLSYLVIMNSGVSDITPLVNNNGIGSGDYVNLHNSLLDCADPATQSNIAILEGRVADLVYECDAP